MAKYKDSVSTRIEIGHYQVGRITDPVQFAEIFFPQSNAGERRASFLAIFREIKNSPNQKIRTTDYIADKYSLSKSCVVKARIKMVRIGLIAKRNGNWQFSGVLKNTMQKLVEIIESHKKRTLNNEQRERERLFIELAKA